MTKRQQVSALGKSFPTSTLEDVRAHFEREDRTHPAMQNQQRAAEVARVRGFQQIKILDQPLRVDGTREGSATASHSKFVEHFTRRIRTAPPHSADDARRHSVIADETIKSVDGDETDAICRRIGREHQTAERMADGKDRSANSVLFPRSEIASVPDDRLKGCQFTPEIIPKRSVEAPTMKKEEFHRGSPKLPPSGCRRSDIIAATRWVARISEADL